MTREEAIKILDPETTAEALAEIEYYAGFSGQTAKVQAVSEACEIAVAALMEQENVTNRNGLNRTESDTVNVVEIDQFKTNAIQRVSNAPNALENWISVEERLPEHG